MPEYKQVFPAANLSLEKETATVPNDGRFHVTLQGKIIGSFRSLKQAQAKYQELRSVFVAEHPVAKEPRKIDLREVREREAETMSNKRLLWGPEDFERLNRKTKKIPRA